MKCVFLRAAGWLLFYLWPIQRSWCQNGGWSCHCSLFSLFFTSARRTVTFCWVSGFSPRLDWDREEELEEKYPLSSGSSERRDGSVYLGKLIDWEERWWWGGKEEKWWKGQREEGQNGSVSIMWLHLPSPPICSPAFIAPLCQTRLLLVKTAEKNSARSMGGPTWRIVNNLVLSLIKSIPTFVIFGTSLLMMPTFW